MKKNKIEKLNGISEPMLPVRMVYVIQIDKGSQDDFSWWIHGIYDSPFKADEEKRKVLIKIDESLKSENCCTSHQAKNINEVTIKEYKLNEIASR